MNQKPARKTTEERVNHKMKQLARAVSNLVQRNRANGYHPDKHNREAGRRAKTVIDQAVKEGHYDDRECAIDDFIADLMHLCDQSGIDFEATLERARGHFTAEKTGKEAA